MPYASGLERERAVEIDAEVVSSQPGSAQAETLPEVRRILHIRTAFCFLFINTYT